MINSQPEIIAVEPGLRLASIDGDHSFALPWYKDHRNLHLMDNDDDEYDIIRLEWMYAFLKRVGELYFIQILIREGVWKAIGDVAMSSEDFSILIGERKYRHQGIGVKVISTMAERAKELGYDAIRVREIYRFNEPAIACFLSCGFELCGKTKDGYSYVLPLDP